MLVSLQSASHQLDSPHRPAVEAIRLVACFLPVAILYDSVRVLEAQASRSSLFLSSLD
jgi:hypothetical protein